MIAYPYRALDALQIDASFYKAQLRVAENLLAFLGSIGLALAVAIKSLSGDENRNLSREILSGYWRAGISPGDWQDIGSKTASMMRGNEQYAAVSSFANVWFRGRGAKPSDFAKLLPELVKLKNDFKHDRGPQTAHDYMTAMQEMSMKLKQCLQGVAFSRSTPDAPRTRFRHRLENQ